MAESSFLDFAPVSLRSRHKGWTPGRQRAFIRWLAKGLRPGRTAARVGMSRKSAYALRSRPGGQGFAAAWERRFDNAALIRLPRRTARLLEKR
jgi:hypothetical protein